MSKKKSPRAEAHPFMARVAEEPWLLQPESADFVSAALNHVLAHEAGEEATQSLAFFEEEDEDFWDEEGFAVRYGLRPYIVREGTLLVPVQGVLLNGFPYSFGRYATGYEYITRAVERGARDANVERIALVIDSPGGTVAGCFECAERIAEIGQETPVASFAADSAYSAAFAIGVVGESFSVTRSGGTGSVGVLTMHVDLSKAMEQRGVKVTYIFAGKHKVDGNPYEPLPDSVKGRIQKRVDTEYATFVRHVAEHRGISEETVRDTEALTYTAEESVEIGFADSVGKLEDQLAAFSGSRTEEEEEEMTLSTQKKTSASKPEEGASQAAIDAARAEGHAEGMTAGQEAERTRVTAILDSDEAATRPEATKMMIDLGVPSDKALERLAKLPEEKPTAKTEDKKDDKKMSAFERAMQGTDNPNVGSDEGNGSDDGKGKMSVADRIFESAGYKAAN